MEKDRLTCYCLCSAASTSTAHLLPPSQFLLQQSTSSFHSSAATHEKKRKLVARLKKKENLARRQKAREQLIATAPDPVRGYGPNNQDLWYKSELRKILLFPDEVYEGKAANLGMLDRLPKAGDEILGPVGVKSDDLIMKPPATSTSTTPSTYLSFGLSAEDEKLLLQDLPEADETIATANNTKGQKDGAQAAHKLAEEHKAEAARRILDLANANARGIRFENTRRIIRRFGQGEGTGRSEVVGEFSIPQACYLAAWRLTALA